MTRTPLYQRKLTEKNYMGGTTSDNIEAAGDRLEPKQEGTLRLAFQNIHGASDLRGWIVPSETEAMEDLEIDVMGMAETNKPWSPQQKDLYDAYMRKRFRASRTVYTAAPTIFRKRELSQVLQFTHNSSTRVRRNS
jgi:hypothetical protein